MSPRRFLLEFSVFGAACAGALVGYSAGQQCDPSMQIFFAFVGMGIGGAMTDFCLRG